LKTAIYIEDGDVQLVLTPENEWEKNSLNSFGDEMSVTVMRGQFYGCRGGWHRQSSEYGNDGENSLILRVKKTHLGEYRDFQKEST
jgi:hypothetical protein